jgi:hypothetical protein
MTPKMVKLFGNLKTARFDPPLAGTIVPCDIPTHKTGPKELSYSVAHLSSGGTMMVRRTPQNSTNAWVS